jgi:hypothetical protein
MKLELNQEELAALLSNINRVLETGVPWEDKTLHHPAGAIIDAVLTIKGTEKKKTDEGNGEGFETNGWQWDWWQQFQHGGKDYTLSGSGYYGGHSFHVAD